MATKESKTITSETLEDAPSPSVSTQGFSLPSIPIPVLVITAVLLLFVLLFFGRLCSSATVITVNINGTPTTLHGGKTIQTALRESGQPINPGDCISVQGNILERGGGYTFYATVNNEEVTDESFELHDGDDIVLRDGEDRIEDYDATEEVLPYDAIVTGAGALCQFEPGREGIIEHRKGRISGEEVQVTTQTPESAMAVWHHPAVGVEKVIALTFDAGPSENTEEILNILEENDARATFFCCGSQVATFQDTILRARNAGHQLASNTFSGSIDETTTADDLESEIDSSFRILTEAIETDQISRVIRFPRALLTQAMAVVASNKVDSVIGWDIDTEDWIINDPAVICETLLNAQSGSIVELHDGGGDCSNTVEALRRALPQLKERGFRFVTVDELLAYPAQDTE